MPYSDPEKQKQWQAGWRERNRPRERARRRAYYIDNREKALAATASWLERNPEYRSRYNREYERTRRAVDVGFKLRRALRNRLRSALLKGQKAGSAVRDLGLSIELFKAWIEGQFEEGMTWDNYGRWHLDHVVPLSSFDLTNREQFLVACNWYNYQPLWARDNLSKGAR